MPLDIRRSDLTSSVATALIDALNHELSAQYPEPGATHFRLDPSEVADGHGAFLVAFAGDEPAGCGAVRTLEPTTAEIKRMYVVPTMRRRGVGRAMLAALIEEARMLGVTRVVLETGTRQTEALALYEQAGFTPIPVYGEYVGSPVSVCLAKDV
jgi:putative acetyltransferase